MEESSRTFTSTPSDYSLTCSSKDHISSPPRKKHSMVLNLGTKSSSVFTDQTPTPTRFIRNCEEVGLFQDLQNVNPFEETFRKAVESGKTGSLALQTTRMSSVGDDTLHTPHVFPHIIENDSVSRFEPVLKTQQEKTGEGEDRGVFRQVLKVIRQEADTSQLRPIKPTPAPAVAAGEEKQQPVQLILQMPDGRLMQLNATPLEADKKSDLQGPVDLVVRVDKNKTEMNSVILHTGAQKKESTEKNISPLIREKLKARISNAVVIHAPKTTNGNITRGKQMGQKEEGGKGKRTYSVCNTSNGEEDEEIKRQKVLERNRAAAMRCREKRKFWVATLEQRADQMLLANHQLQQEVTSLKSQVATLQTLLLAHKDCPVTQAMYSTSEMSGVLYPVEVAPMLKNLSAEETVFRQNLKKKLKIGRIKKPPNLSEKEENVMVAAPKKKRLSLDIETAQKSHCLSEKTSPLVMSDKYLSSTLLPNDPLELDLHKPVATQVIQVNPNALYRDSHSRMASPLLPLPISPNTNSINYS